MPSIKIKVWGSMACFSIPGITEPFSYNVMTPSAARNILQAIYWKPRINWRVTRIHVLHPINRMSLKLNEVKRIPAMEEGKDPSFIAAEHRTQRVWNILRDVAYVIEADLKLHPVLEARGEAPWAYVEQFNRRVARGSCHTRPYLGCKDWPADFAPVSEDRIHPQPIDMILGPMLFDLRYPLGSDGKTTLLPEPVYFNARLEQGTLHVPVDLYDQTTVWKEYCDSRAD